MINTKLKTQQVVIMRHAERLDDIDKDWSSARPWDTPLSERGLEEACKVGESLKAQGLLLTRIYCSPFLRCIQTALRVAQALSDITKVTVCWGLSEALFRIQDCPKGSLNTWIWGQEGPPSLHTCFGLLDSSAITFPHISLQLSLTDSRSMQRSSSLHTDEPKRSPEILRLQRSLSNGVNFLDSTTLGLSHCPVAPERAEEAMSRFKSVINLIADAHPDENVLLVTHGDAVGHAVTMCQPEAVAYEVSYTGYLIMKRTQCSRAQTSVDPCPELPADIWSLMAAAASSVQRKALSSVPQHTVGSLKSDVRIRGMEAEIRGKHASDLPASVANVRECSGSVAGYPGTPSGDSLGFATCHQEGDSLVSDVQSSCYPGAVAEEGCYMAEDNLISSCRHDSNSSQSQLKGDSIEKMKDAVNSAAASTTLGWDGYDQLQATQVEEAVREQPLQLRQHCDVSAEEECDGRFEMIIQENSLSYDIDCTEDESKDYLNVSEGALKEPPVWGLWGLMHGQEECSACGVHWIVMD
ncbi:hypothetical protein CEUSTIGMA_g167.t1 [Chlamydomonas eustigma]|uniref:Phosphoglycerate mutase family protein n=1 Tax=Chlamydomonas eustigma TaxID=1157962 RepID=A0A250WPJ8_9CHLO|nr:hypothetical protein CEUSTIGMA_g167.t1 [Chlamydomonas eustigma]|eukprot:GAX72711.1 hypothetical protein CEUSTIGMA_g167.t1 [Chlamydomonas eustigma]